MSKAFERILFILIMFLGIVLFIKCEALSLENEYEEAERVMWGEE